MQKITYILICLLLSACGTSYKQTKHEQAKTMIVSDGDLNYNKHQNNNSVAPASHNNIWRRIVSGFKLPSVDKKHLQAVNKTHITKKEHIEKIANQSNPYIFYIVDELQKRDMPLEIALIPMVESSYNPFLVSKSNAAGLWQFIPSTGKIFNLENNAFYDARADIISSTNAALNYFQYLHNKFNGDWLLAIAAYNGGEGKIRRAIESNSKNGRKTDYWSLVDISVETKNYVPKLLAYKEVILAPEKFNAILPNIPNEPYFSVYHTNFQNVSLMDIANNTNNKIDEIYKLNPAYKRGIIKHSSTLLLPVKSTNYENLIAINEHKTQKLHTVKPGENLDIIAFLYKIRVEDLIAQNGLTNNVVSTGQVLEISDGNDENYRYTVKTGDTLYSIARNNNISVNKLKVLNNINSDQISQGQLLTIRD